MRERDGLLLLSSEQTDVELRRLRFMLTPAPSISSRRLACGEDSIVQIIITGGQEHGVKYKSGQAERHFRGWVSVR